MVAITPGFGISGTANSNSVTVPAAAMAQLNRGVYDLYVMGSDADNNVVALDQKQVWIVKPKPYGNWVGVFRPSDTQFILNNGTQRTLVTWGLGTDKPVSGDWNGDHLADVGVYRPSANLTGGNNFILKNGTERTVIRWGMGTDIPVAGDWNNDGFGDVGVYRPAIQMFILKNGTEKSKMLWGHPTDLPVTGKWS